MVKSQEIFFKNSNKIGLEALQIKAFTTAVNEGSMVRQRLQYIVQPYFHLLQRRPL
jgi:hypothetical protein